MATSELEMILRTTREGDAPQDAVKDLNEMKTGLSDLEKTMAGTRTTIGGLDRDIGGMGANLGSVNDLMNELGFALPITPMAAFGQAIQAGAQFAKESLSEFAAYADQISKMAAYTSTSTEEMSKLYQVADDLRIPVGDLEMALKSMTDKGTAPSIEGIQQLSEKYLSIQDPLERAQFLTENFGRAGQEMGRLMEMGAEGIGAAADSIEEWMIITGKSEEQIKAYLATQDRWGEALDEIKYKFAMDVMPAVTNFMNAILDTNDEIDNSRAAWMRYIPILSAVQELWVGIKNVVSNFKAPTPPATTGVSGRAEGGSVDSPTLYKVGEREVEYYEFPMGGSIVPSSGGGGTIIEINYSSVVSLSDRAEAERVLIPYIREALRSI